MGIIQFEIPAARRLFTPDAVTRGVSTPRLSTLSAPSPVAAAMRLRIALRRLRHSAGLSAAEERELLKHCRTVEALYRADFVRLASACTHAAARPPP